MGFAGRASPGIFDGFGWEAGGDQAQPSRRWEVQVYGTVPMNQRLFGESSRHLGPDLVAAASNAGAEVGPHGFGAGAGGITDRQQDGFGNPQFATAPPSVGGTDGPVGLKEDRQAIGAGDRQRETRRAADGPVAGGVMAGRVHAHDVCAVDLPKRGHTIGLEAEGAKQAAPVLGHRFSGVIGGMAEIERIVGWMADAAETRAEAHPRPGLAGLLGGLIPMEPRRHRRGEIQGPHGQLR